MQMKIVITLHVYLFLRQLIKNHSIVLTVFLKKAKKLQKNSSVELNLNTKEDSTSSLLYI